MKPSAFIKNVLLKVMGGGGGVMRNKGGREDVKCLGFSSHCGDRHSFFSEICRYLGIILFPLPLTPAD